MNNYRKNQLGNYKPDPVFACKLTKSDDQTIATSTWTLIDWNEVEIDPASPLGIANDEEMVLGTVHAGLYILMTTISWANNSTGLRKIQIKDGSTAICESSMQAGGPSTFTLASIWNFPTGGVLTVEVWQSSGGNLNCNTNKNTVHFTIARLGRVA